MKRFLSFLIIAGMLAGSANCAWFRGRFGSPPDPREVPLIVPGQTTRADVEKAFGAPDAVARLGSGDVYLYRYDEAKLVGWTILVFSWASADVKPDRLLVSFDDRGVVTHVAYRNDAPKVEFDFWP